MTNNTDTLTPVLTAISTADEAQLDTIFQAIKNRDKTLREIKKATALATLKVGQSVTIGDIRPKYLTGLVGEITEIRGQYATVRLDTRSTHLLSCRSTKYAHLCDRDSYDIDGIPVSVLEAN